MAMIEQFCGRLNLDIDFRNPELLLKSIKRVMSTVDPVIRDALSALLTLPMQLATYICAHNCPSESWWHYGLSIPYYTHFTSPIRRYADVTVHRLLAEGLRSQTAAEELNTPARIKEYSLIAKQCNLMREAARNVQLRCDRIYMAIYVSRHVIESIGLVIGIGNKSFTIMDTTYGLTERLFVDDMEGFDATYDSSNSSIILTATSDQRSSDLPSSLGEMITIQLLSKVKIQLCIKKLPPIDIAIRLKRSV